MQNRDKYTEQDSILSSGVNKNLENDKEHFNQKNLSSSNGRKVSSRKALGRGLENLFPPLQIKENDFSVIGIEKIKPNASQPRRDFNKESLKELAESIRVNGLIHPIVVRPLSLGEYEIIAGRERRWRAAQLAGLHKISARVWNKTEEQSSILALVENLQRQNLNPIEQAKAYKNIMEQKNWTQDQLAYQLAVPRASLANQLRLLYLADEVQAWIKEKKLSVAHAKLLLKLKDPAKQIHWGKIFILKRMGIRAAENLLSQTAPINNKEQTKKTHTVLLWQKQALKKIQETHGINVNLSFHKKGGNLNIRFYSEENLKFILQLLLDKKP